LLCAQRSGGGRALLGKEQAGNKGQILCGPRIFKGSQGLKGGRPCIPKKSLLSAHVLDKRPKTLAQAQKLFPLPSETTMRSASAADKLRQGGDSAILWVWRMSRPRLYSPVGLIRRIGARQHRPCRSRPFCYLSPSHLRLHALGCTHPM
jgi:hypothetical protein